MSRRRLVVKRMTLVERYRNRDREWVSKEIARIEATMPYQSVRKHVTHHA
mgnify:CR=1 FL=1